MSFTTAWDETKPDGGRDIILGDDDIREFKEQVRQRFGVDHSMSAADDANTGYHLKTTLLKQASDPLQVSSSLILYAKQVGSFSELFSRHENAALQQLTLNGKLWAEALTCASIAQGDIFYHDGTKVTRLPAGTAEQVLKTNGAGANPAWATFGGRLLSVNIYTSSSTWTKPTGCTSALVRVIGGGGGGRGGVNGVYSAGGAGAGYSEKYVTSPGATETVSIGAAGTGASAGSDGGDGGTSSFGSHCSASGGQGGRIAGSTPGVGSSGDINLSGEPTRASTTIGNTGDGGDAPLGFGYGAFWPNTSEVGLNGLAGSGYGSGGSGGVNSGTGGNGTQGLVIVYNLA